MIASRFLISVSALRLFSLIVFCLVFYGCAHRQTLDDEWPSNIPAKSIFENSYDSDSDNAQLQSRNEYLTWIKRFYNGWIVYSYGWNQMTEDLKAGTKELDQAANIESEIGTLGIRLAKEWAKSKEDRFVRTREMSIWGETLRESILLGTSLELIRTVDQDLNALGSGELNPLEINSARYSNENDDPWEF